MHTLQDIDIALLVVVASVISSFVSLAVWVSRHPHASLAELDTEATARIQGISADPNAIAEIRAAYEHAGEMQKHALGIVASIIGQLAPLTPVKVDDAAAALLTTITEPDTVSIPSVFGEVGQPQTPMGTLTTTNATAAWTAIQAKDWNAKNMGDVTTTTTTTTTEAPAIG